MLRWRGVPVVAALLVTLGCSEEPRVVHLTLELPDALGCRPTRVEEVEVRALGDFPTRDPNVLIFDPASGPKSVDRFPDETRVVTVEARGVIGPERWIGGGVAEIGDASEDALVTLLRYGRACPLADAHARVPEGAALVALPDGRLWIAGGDDGERVLDAIVGVRPGDPLAMASAARLFVDRTSASATYVGEELVVVAGGSSALAGAAEDTFEVVRVREGDEARVGDGFLGMRRRDHAAVALAGGSVLLVGGREGTGEPPLDDLELLTLSDDGSAGTSRSVARLAIARASHHALTLEDGTIAIAGGVDERGDAIGSVERFDPRTGELRASAASFPPRAGAAYVALAGGRVAQIGGREGDAWTGKVELLLAGGETIALGEVIPALEAPVAAALPDGALVVIGRDLVDRRARGVRLDPGSASAEPIEASRAASALVPLRDGSLAEGDPSGLSLLRVALATPFDAPPATIAPALMEDRARLALDAPGRWQPSRGELVALVDGARLDVPGLRFAAFDATLEVSGAVDVLIVRDGDAPLVLTMSQDALTLGDCRSERVEGSALHLARAGGTLTLDAGAGALECALALPERVGLAVRAHAGAGVRSIALARR